MILRSHPHTEACMSMHAITMARKWCQLHGKGSMQPHLSDRCCSLVPSELQPVFAHPPCLQTRRHRSAHWAEALRSDIFKACTAVVQCRTLWAEA